MLLKEQHFKSLLIGVFVRLISIIVAGILLTAVHAYMVHSGHIPIGLNLNPGIHFVSVTIVGAFAMFLSKNKNIVVLLITCASLYLLLLFVSITVLDGLSTYIVGNVIGGFLGFCALLLTAISRKKKAVKWKTKKYHG